MDFTDIYSSLTNVYTVTKTQKKVSLHSSQIIQEQVEFPVGHLYPFFFETKLVVMLGKSVNTKTYKWQCIFDSSFLIGVSV